MHTLLGPAPYPTQIRSKNKQDPDIKEKTASDGYKQ